MNLNNQQFEQKGTDAASVASSFVAVFSSIIISNIIIA
jgi:hypothetical protein